MKNVSELPNELQCMVSAAQNGAFQKKEPGRRQSEREIGAGGRPQPT